MTALLKELREVFALSAKNFKDLLTQATEAGLEQVINIGTFLFFSLRSRTFLCERVNGAI